MDFLAHLINGISLGSIYAIIALGYTMVYGIARMLNFAHGDVIMIGSYLVFITVSTMGVPTILGIIIAMVVCTLLGMTIEKVAYSPLRNATSLAVLITAIGVSYFLQNKVNSFSNMVEQFVEITDTMCIYKMSPKSFGLNLLL